MNLSQRSILFSLVVHCSLFVSGLFLYTHFQSEPGSLSSQGQDQAKFTVRPIKLAKASGPVARSSQPPAPRTSKPAPSSVPELSPAPEPAPSPRQEVSPARVVPRVQASYPQAKATPGAGAPSGEKRPVGTRRRGWNDRTVPLWTPTPSPTATPGPVQAPPAPTEPKKKGPSRPARPLFIPQIDLSAKFPEVTSASVTVRFLVHPDGTFEVTMTEGTGNLDADLYILESLRSQARWSPRLESGEPVEDRPVVDLDIER